MSTDKPATFGLLRPSSSPWTIDTGELWVCAIRNSPLFLLGSRRPAVTSPSLSPCPPDLLICLPDFWIICFLELYSSVFVFLPAKHVGDTHNTSLPFRPQCKVTQQSDHLLMATDAYSTLSSTLTFCKKGPYKKLSLIEVWV